MCLYVYIYFLSIAIADIIKSSLFNVIITQKRSEKNVIDIFVVLYLIFINYYYFFGW